jgi:hypothetical protein
MCFKDVMMKQLVEESTEKRSHKELMVIVGEKWKNLKVEEKEQYIEMSKADIA